jgi:hypothetical protein
MQEWRARAVETFPNLKNIIEQQSGIIALWIGPLCSLEAAMRAPSQRKFIGKIYDYAAWCINQPQDQGADLEDPFERRCRWIDREYPSKQACFGTTHIGGSPKKHLKVAKPFFVTTCLKRCTALSRMNSRAEERIQWTFEVITKAKP